jgi:hypothetical protein
LSRKFSVTPSTATAASIARGSTTTRYNKKVSKDSGSTLPSKKNLEYARHL